MNYQESEVTGTKYRRCYKIEIFNHRNEIPSIIFSEEDIYYLSNSQSISNTSGNLIVEFDPNKEIQMIDLETLEPIEGQNKTFAEIYHILFSAYINSAKERDLKNEQNSSFLQ